MNLNKIVNKLFIVFIFSMTVEPGFATNFVAPPGLSNTEYMLQPGPPPDTLTVPAGSTVVTPGPVGVTGITATLYGGNTVTNFGTMTSNNSTTIFASPGGIGLMYVNNYGTLNAPLIAIDFAGVGPGGAQVDNAGIINGQIILPTNYNSTLNITVSITGSITKNPGAGIATLNVNGNFATSSYIDQMANINVNAPFSTFTINNSITNFGIFTNYYLANVIVNNGTTLMNGNIINNYGNFQLNNGTIAVNNFINTGNLIIAGGTLSGNIIGIGQDSSLTIQNNFTTAGNITNVENINVQAGTFTITYPIIGYNSLNNQSTINLSGGSLSGGITAVGTTSTINVNSFFTSAGSMSARDINVTPGAYFVANNPLTVSRGITIQPTAAMELNNVVSGNLTNNGVLFPNNSAYISGNYIQSTSGTLGIFIGDTQASPYSNITVGGTASVAGNISVILPADGGIDIPNNNYFDIIKTTGGGVFLSNPTVIQPDSFVLSFSLATPTPQILRLIAKRRLFQNITTNPTLTGVAGALEQIRANKPTTAQRTLLAALDSAGSLGEFENSLSQLVPITNGGIIYTALETQKLNFDKVSTRLDSLQAGLDSFQTGNSYVAGDMITTGRASVGPYFLVNAIKQNRQDRFDGFTSTSGGLGILADTPIGCYIKVGGTLSYIVSTVKVDNPLGNQTTINYSQGSLYGRFEYGWPFAEVMYSLGFNQYRNRRNIAFLNQVATADYHGYQQGGKLRAGVAIPIGTLELTPQAWWQYTRLRLKQYGEKGGVAALTVVGSIYSIVESAYGVRIADISEPELFYPELHIMGLMFNKEPNFAITSQFTEGGPAFVTPGPTLRKTGGNIGGSISALLSDGFVIIGGYDYYVRKNYNSHALSLKLRYLF